MNCKTASFALSAKNVCGRIASALQAAVMMEREVAA
jgi:hypothetical protein